MDDATAQSVVFEELFGKPVLAHFYQPDSSSDGGAILLKACDRNLSLINAISSCLRDDRQQGKVSHTIRNLVQQRVFGIACGYEDCNEFDWVDRTGELHAGNRSACPHQWLVDIGDGILTIRRNKNELGEAIASVIRRMHG